jgi:hypothetical protein
MNMIKITTPLLITASIMAVADRATADEQDDAIFTAARVTLKWDTRESPRWTSLLQLSNNRELLASPGGGPVFRVALEGAGGRTRVLTARHATQGTARPLDDGWQLTWQGFPERSLIVRATLRRSSTGGVAVRLAIENNTYWPVRSVSFPIVECRLPLSESGKGDAVLFPRHEGVLLREPHLHFTREGMWETERYPGHASAQLLAYYGGGGGAYIAAHDSGGHPKDLRVRRGSDGLELAVVHLCEISAGAEWSQPYDVVVDAFDGDWTAAADLYREWARRQPWCADRIRDRDIAPWLTQGAGFYNYPAQARGQAGQALPFFPPAAAADALSDLHDRLGAPVVAAPFSWEKQAVWIGPDYFPPRGGAQAWRDLASSLHSRGDRLMVFLSGFRYGLSKPGTDIDNSAAFEARGQEMAVRDRQGEVVIDERPWARNALLCPGHAGAREMLLECLRQAYDLGIDVVQLDQDVGGAVADCYAPDHGHPPGPGVWQREAMDAFLADVRREVRLHGRDRALTVEEPCELYIPRLDAYHGRAFTYEHWPATGKGAVSVPLFIYLYHPYLPGYAGWTGGGFDLPGRVELSIGRAFIFGMLVGVRANVWSPSRDEQDSTAFRMWRDAVHLQRRCAPALLLGDMTSPPRLRGTSRQPETRRAPGHGDAPLPLNVESVQATAWRDDDGQFWYAIANVEAEPSEVEIRLPVNVPWPAMNVVRIDPTGEHRPGDSTQAGEWMPLYLKPFGICCLRISEALTR